MQAKDRKEIHTEKIAAGKRMYYFDVKESKDGTRYLVISEAEHGNAEHHRVMIFEESLKSFTDALHNAVTHVVRQPGNPEKAYKVEAVRKEFPNAYAKWTASDDELLRQKHAEGVKIPEVAKLLNRKEGGIKSRLTKLGLLTP